VCIQRGQQGKGIYFTISVLKKDTEANWEVSRTIAKTPPFVNNTEIFIAETFSMMDSDVPLDFTQVVISAWKSGQSKETMLSQVTIPRALIVANALEDEEWQMLAPVSEKVERKISGQVKITITYTEVKENRPCSFNIQGNEQVFYMYGKFLIYCSGRGQRTG
jgi:hypothetical protein